MFTFLKNLFSQERVNKEINESVTALINKTNRSINTKVNILTRNKLESLTKLNDDLTNATYEMKQVSSDLINKLNNQIEGLTTEIKAISETSSEGIITLDYRGVIINLNHSVEKMFGYDFNQLTGKDISKILPICISGYNEKEHHFTDVMKSVSQNIFNNLKFKGGSLDINKYFSLSKKNKRIVGKTRSGKNIFLEINVNIINPGITSYEKLQYICIIKDVTELTSSKNEIKNLAKFQLSLVEAIPNAVYWKDKNYRYIGCNSEFEKISGFKRKEIIGKTLTELYKDVEKTMDNISPSDLEEKNRLIEGEEHIKKLIENAQKNGTPLTNIKRTPIKNKLYNKNTKEYKDVIIYRTIFINENGEFDGLVCSIMDITKLLSDGSL